MPRSRSPRTSGGTRRRAARRPAEVERLLELYDRAWRGPSWHGPSVLESLEGVTARQAGARPVGKAHSIGELVLHMATWKRTVARRLAGRPYDPADAENFPPFRAGDWSRAKATLEKEHRRLRRVLAGLEVARLAEPALRGSQAVFLQAHGVVHHDLWHAGQILVLRRALGHQRGR